MNLTTIPDRVEWPPTHFVFVERAGRFMRAAPEAGQEAQRLAPLLRQHNRIIGVMNLYSMNPNVWRAGFRLEAAPVKLPRRMKYELFEGGLYSRFVLTGPYSDLPAANGRVFEIVYRTNMALRSGYCIENYLDDPETTPEDQYRTEILVPTV